LDLRLGKVGENGRQALFRHLNLIICLNSPREQWTSLFAVVTIPIAVNQNTSVTIEHLISEKPMVNGDFLSGFPVHLGIAWIKGDGPDGMDLLK